MVAVQCNAFPGVIQHQQQTQIIVFDLAHLQAILMIGFQEKNPL